MDAQLHRQLRRHARLSQAGFSCAINKLTERVLDLDKIKDIRELRPLLSA